MGLNEALRLEGIIVLPMDYSSYMNRSDLKYTFDEISTVVKNTALITGRLDRKSHMKWRETKQQLSRARSGHQISCWLFYLHFLCDMPTLPVPAALQRAALT